MRPSRLGVSGLFPGFPLFFLLLLFLLLFLFLFLFSGAENLVVVGPIASRFIVTFFLKIIFTRLGRGYLFFYLRFFSFFLFFCLRFFSFFRFFTFGQVKSNACYGRSRHPPTNQKKSHTHNSKEFTEACQAFTIESRHKHPTSLRHERSGRKSRSQERSHEWTSSTVGLCDGMRLSLAQRARQNDR